MWSYSIKSGDPTRDRPAEEFVDIPLVMFVDGAIDRVERVVEGLVFAVDPACHVAE